MDQLQQFWWNWWVNAAVALGTLAAVLVALFGRVLQSKLFPPVLQMSLVCPEGEKGRIKYSLRESVSFEDARYYHMRVENLRRWSPALDVQVFMTRLEEPGPDGSLHVVWTGNLPMGWRHREISPLTRTIGPATDCDLCCVTKNKRLDLLPLIVPLQLDIRRTSKCQMVVSLQAKSHLADSSVYRVQIAWDGEWNDGETEMMRHLRVTEITVA